MVRKIPKTAARAAGKAAGKAAETLSAASQFLDTRHLPANMRDSAQQIWLAGMGAFARAQAEGGKVFDTLMKEGMSLQRKTQGMAEDKIHEVAGKMTSMAGEVQSRAGQQWDKLESIFEQRTAKALAKLGVPTAKDVEALIKRVDELAAAVARLSGGPSPVKADKSPRRSRAEAAAVSTEPAPRQAAARRKPARSAAEPVAAKPATKTRRRAAAT